MMFPVLSALKGRRGCLDRRIPQKDIRRDQREETQIEVRANRIIENSFGVKSRHDGPGKARSKLSLEITAPQVVLFHIPKDACPEVSHKGERKYLRRPSKRNRLNWYG